ncbi:protein of unknown function [Candidatus Promineifilum breve]|uniref:Uncharacterized protein n=1 Tax=Candidatus Promineifilum breve TaxID=1806508 RepID=A0A160T3E0_9CHLR|nr:protein of unknown function [Candidatus Promineifilum breve]
MVVLVGEQGGRGAGGQGGGGDFAPMALFCC